MKYSAVFFFYHKTNPDRVFRENLIFIWLLWIRQNFFFSMRSSPVPMNTKKIQVIISKWEQMSFSHAHTHTSLISHCFCFMPMSSSLVSSRISSRVKWWVSPLWCLVWKGKNGKIKRCKKREFKLVTATSASVDYSLTAFNYCHVRESTSFHCGELPRLTHTHTKCDTVCTKQQ